jgi:ribonucleotide monophosphatase NagD (HAD superfamily)
MVLTGVSNQKDATESPFQPTWIMDNITSIALALKNAHQSTTQ